jgi:hypothetical protein
MAREQSLSTHRRFYPLYHFVVIPILTINAAIEIQRAIEAGNGDRWWTAVFAVGVLLLSLTARTMAL